MSDFTLAIAAGAAMVLMLAAIAYFRGNVPGFLAALYCLLLTVGCVVIFYRNASHSPAASQRSTSAVRSDADTAYHCWPVLALPLFVR